MCQASHVQARDIVGPLILLQLWAWERFPCIAPQKLKVFPHDIIGDDGLPFPPPLLGTWYIQKLMFSCKNFIENFTYILSQLTCYYFILDGKMFSLSQRYPRMSLANIDLPLIYKGQVTLYGSFTRLISY